MNNKIYLISTDGWHDSIYMDYFATNEDEIKAIINERLSTVSINAELKDFVFDYEKKEVHFKWMDDFNEWDNMTYYLHESKLITICKNQQ